MKSKTLLPSPLKRPFWASAAFIFIQTTIAAPSGVYLNEILVDPPGTDAPNEFIELRGPAGTSLSGVYLISVNGDSGASQGQIAHIVSLSASSVGSNGYLVIRHPSASYPIASGTSLVDVAGLDFPNASYTFFLVHVGSGGSAPVLGQDMDASNNGLDPLPAQWTILDGISVSDSGNTDRSYAPIAFLANANSITEPGATVIVTNFGPDNVNHILRIGDTTGSSASDWAAVDVTGSTAPNFVAIATTDSTSFPIGSVTSDTLGAQNLGSTSGPPTGGGLVSQGTVPPGTSAGTQFASIRPEPKINQSNRVAFRAWLQIGVAGVTATNDTGIWYQDSTGALTLAAREGDTIPGGGDFFGSLNINPSWTDSGILAWTSRLLANHSGIWVRQAGTSSLLLKGNDPAPGIPGAIVSSLDFFLAQNESQYLATRMQLKLNAGGVTVWNDGAVIGGTPGNLTVIAREGDPAPGTAGRFAGLLSTDWTRLDEFGNVLFHGALASQVSPKINSYNNNGIWLHQSGSNTTIPVALAGDQAPGLAAGVLYYLPRWGVLSRGKVAFRSQLRGAGISAGVNDYGIFSGTPGAITGIAQMGGAAPAGVSGSQFSKFSYPVIGLGTGREVAFRAEMKAGLGGVTLATNEGIWKESGGTSSLVVRKGNAVPGLSGVTFGKLGEPFVGENGKVVFSAKLLGTGITSTNDSAWFAESSGTLALLLREGASMNTDGGTRILDDLLTSYALPEHERVLNVGGRLAIQVPYVGKYTGIVTMDIP